MIKVSRINNGPGPGGGVLSIRQFQACTSARVLKTPISVGVSNIYQKQLLPNIDVIAVVNLNIQNGVIGSNFLVKRTEDSFALALGTIVSNNQNVSINLYSPDMKITVVVRYPGYIDNKWYSVVTIAGGMVYLSQQINTIAKLGSF